MSVSDVLRFSSQALRGHRLRTGLSLLGVAIGVAAVVLLTSLGEGARIYVTDEFASLGTNLVIVLPGKTETTGGVPIAGGVPHDLTLDDAIAVERRIPSVKRVAPIALGTARVRFGERSREATVIGTTSALRGVRKLDARLGRYLPEGDLEHGSRTCVIGSHIQEEVFPGKNPLGELVRVGDERYRVIGVLAPQGKSLGMDLDESVHIPVSQALRMFNRRGLFRLMVEVASHERTVPVREELLALLKERHGEEDVTVLTQDAVHASFSRVLGILTGALAGIAAISLTVAGIGIMNVMLVSVTERTREIGLLKALGATREQVLLVFLVEAAILSSTGGLVGLTVGLGSGRIIEAVYPSFPVVAPHWAIAGALVVSLVVGVVAGQIPARRAAALDPIAALAGESGRMSGRDVVWLAWGSITAHRLRSMLTVLGVLIGIASVILLTSLGEGTRRYLLDEFTQFGTNLVAVNPGKVETSGIPGALGGTIHKLTVADAEAIERIAGVERVLPIAMGMARVEAGERGRSVLVYGVTDVVPEVLTFAVRQGRFLPPTDPRRTSALAVLGPKLKRELFGEETALGEHVRIAGRRFVVVGVMEPKGQILGFDLDDTAWITVGTAERLFNRAELMEIDVTVASYAEIHAVVERIRATVRERHQGEEDFTITTQAEMVGVLDRVLGVVNLGVGAIAAISLLVGAIGILTMMWISVNERTSEIGLDKAIGATGAQILLLFLVESALLSLAGGALGVATGLGLGRLIHWALPALPFHLPWRYVVAALVMSLAVGLASGVLPARRAAHLDPLEALRAE